MAKNEEVELDAPKEQVFAAAALTVADLGYSVLHSDSDAGSIAFNTGASTWSNAGQDMTLTIVAITPQKSRMIIGGTQAQRGGQAQFGSWGERGRITKRLVARLNDVLSDTPEESAELDGTSSSPASASTVDALTQLAELHRSGALTDDEFDAAKRQVLG